MRRTRAGFNSLADDAAAVDLTETGTPHEKGTSRSAERNRRG